MAVRQYALDIAPVDLNANYYAPKAAAQAQQRNAAVQDYQMGRQKVTDAQQDKTFDMAQAAARAEKVASAAYGINDEATWNKVVPQIMQEMGVQGPPPPFAEKANIIARAQTLGQRQALDMQNKKFALDERQTNAQIAASYASADASRASAERARRPEGAGGIDNTTFDNMSGLRREFTQATKTYGEVRDAYGRIKASAEKPSAAGDMSLIFNFMKVLDPGSTVREGEFATAQQATGLPERVVNAYNQAVSGQRLNHDQRNDFVNRAGFLFNRQHETYLSTKGNYDELARRFNFDPSLVTFDQSGGIRGPQAPRAPAPPQSFTRGAGVFDQSQVGKTTQKPGSSSLFDAADKILANGR